jgi:hypothetical protein
MEEVKKRKTGRPRVYPLVTRSCPVCGERFSKTMRLQTCSEKCGYALVKLNSAKRHDKQCIYCKRRYRSWRDEQKFCSLHCSVRGRLGKTRYSTLSIRCEECGKSVLIKPSHRHLARYCSRKCKDQSTRQLPYAQFKRGMKWESDCAKRLRREGYLVFRSALSRGPFDLIAVHPFSAEIKFIQVKGTANRENIDPSPNDRAAIILVDIPSVLEATKEIWRVVEGVGTYESVYPNECDGVEDSEFPVDSEGFPITD